MTGTFWAILPPVIAIILALVTKEVYLSLMIGIASGALMYHDFHLIKAMDTIFAIMGEKIGANCDILIFLVLLGILVALVITLIMRARLLKVHQISQDYNMGDTFDIKNFFEASSVDTYIECDSNDFVPDKLGKYKVKFTVRRGKLSSRKTAKINVVDEVNPYISGPDEIEVKVGQDINWSDYYTVTDADPDIQSKLTSVKDLDTGKARAVNATLTVADWAGNTASKNITVVVTDGDVAN